MAMLFNIAAILFLSSIYLPSDIICRHRNNIPSGDDKASLVSHEAEFSPGVKSKGRLVTGRRIMMIREKILTV